MNYLFENLGDERFQEFCSVLISKEFPNLQAYPVGQPDGGRDSLVYYMTSQKKEFIIFQVKYVRNPLQEKDIHKWLTKIIEQEADKINQLIPAGAKSFYLLTNVSGTAHLGSGSKDKLNSIFEEKIKIPSLCWWRDDLSRLFEKDPIFKWSFPEILNGQDILNSALFNSLNENRERRENVIRAYLSDQFEIDNEVKFKQIDLQNRLLNLFTDVPLRIKKHNEKNKKLKNIFANLYGQKRGFFSEDLFTIEPQNNIGAAEFILHPTVQLQIERILLEGGPGQGKSTISQYICQVHRARLLNKTSDIELIPIQLRGTPVRLPIKIDLRDIAAWVERKNPYQGIVGDDYFEHAWKNSLEAFLVAHMFYHSKLDEFTSSDFIAICKLSPVLFVFDGFDEIANVKVRSEVIDFINKGITRISANVKSIQIIITSRPAAFSDSIGFSIENYPHFELTDITPPIINEYVEKWIKASKMELRDANELRRLIKEKLEMPHLKDLAKSPMQLAIFISLLKTKGQSLPNKRTSLYDNYIELFFDRESEKNNLIRDKRDLIIDIHQYLAWVLHSEAELYKNSGSIHINDLSVRLKQYLSSEGHETAIADQLFDVMKERVCALVSRVQGTFEFEVQPLREYFCAKYLYKSAPHSSAGSVKSGTKPDRLHAILRNFYWQNVVRFFSGCADAGELDMIIQELKDLQNDPLLKYTNYPRIITAQILSDYVFTQKPLKLKSVVKIIVDGINLGNVLNQDRRYASNEPLQLPNECGRTEVVAECFQQLTQLPNSDYSNELIGIINNNPLNNLEIWASHVPKYKGSELTKWLSYAYKLGLIHKIDETLLVYILNEKDQTQERKRLQLVIDGNRVDVIDKNISLKQIAFKGVLNNEITVNHRKLTGSGLNILSIVLRPWILGYTFRSNDGNINFAYHIFRFVDIHESGENPVKFMTDFSVKDDVDTLIKDFITSISSVFTFQITEFKNQLDPWDKIVENGRRVFNDAPIFDIIATIGAGVKSKEGVGDEYEELHNNSLSLCKRLRYARMKSGNIKYWEHHLAISSNQAFVLLVFLSWGTAKVITELMPIISKIVKALDLNSFTQLVRSLNITGSYSTFNKGQQKLLEAAMQATRDQDDINFLISLRFDSERRQAFVYNNIRKFEGNLKKAIEIKFHYLITSYLKEPSKADTLSEVKALYQNNLDYDDRLYDQLFGNERIHIPIEIARSIMNDCKNYPKIISTFAEKSCRRHASEHLVPVGKTAKDDRWFI